MTMVRRFHLRAGGNGKPFGIVLSVCLVVLAGCKPPVLPQLEAIEKAFAPSPAPKRELTGNAVLDLDVYIDASKSMRGFALPEGTQFMHVVQHVLEQGTMGRYRLTPYRFTSDVTALPQLSVKQATSPDFYNGKDTPLSQLLERIGKTPNRISLVISDMVQSDKINDRLRMVKALQGLASQHFEIRLLGFRSSFRGDYYVESIPGRTIHLQQSERLPGNGRPFYVFVAAPNRASLELLERYVLDRAAAEQSFSPTDAPIVVKKMTFTPPPGKKPVWNPQVDPQQFTNPSGASTHFAAFLEVHPSGMEMSALHLQLTSAVGVPMYSRSRLRMLVRKVTYTKNGGLTKPIDESIQLDGDNTFKDSTNLIYTMTRPRPNSWDIYQIRMHAGEGNLSPPPWVQEWNTDYDLSPNNGNKTFQVALIVESMVHGITEDNVFCEKYIALGRGR